MKKVKCPKCRRILFRYEDDIEKGKININIECPSCGSVSVVNLDTELEHNSKEHLGTVAVNEGAIKGINSEVVNALKDFDEIMNSTFGKEIWETDSKGNEIQGTRRNLTLDDVTDIMHNEWCNTIEKFNQLGIEI